MYNNVVRSGLRGGERNAESVLVLGLSLQFFGKNIAAGLVRDFHSMLASKVHKI